MHPRIHTLNPACPAVSRQGRMSPGMTCVLEVTFTPRINKDIHAHLPLLAETGPINIPLVCTYPKVRDRSG
jgi:hypothetical protein